MALFPALIRKGRASAPAQPAIGTYCALGEEMRHRTSLPLLATLLSLLVTHAACNSTVAVDRGPGRNGAETGGTGDDSTNSASTGEDSTTSASTGEDSTTSASTGEDSTTSASTGEDSTATAGAGGGDSGPACERHAPSVSACVDSAAVPDELIVAAELGGSWTVTAVRPNTSSDPCGLRARQVGYGAKPDVVFDLVDANSNALTLAVRAPGFASSTVAVGDTLDVDFSHQVMEYGDTIGRLRLERDGELIVAVGENDPIGLTLGTGERACYGDDGYCGYEEHALTVATEAGPAVSIANSESAEVGALTVTNERYLKYYDISGSCNFGVSDPFSYVVSAAPTP
jgi:hypothetical protein